MDIRSTRARLPGLTFSTLATVFLSVFTVSSQAASHSFSVAEPDLNFGDNGHAIIDLSFQRDRTDLAIKPVVDQQRNIYVTVADNLDSNPAWYIKRYNESAELDTGWANNGLLSLQSISSDLAFFTPELTNYELIDHLIPQADGGLLLIPGDGTDVYRITPDGAFDQAFDNRGLSFISAQLSHMGNLAFSPESRFIPESTGNILITGITIDEQACLVRLTADGELDNRFGQIHSSETPTNKSGVFCFPNTVDGINVTIDDIALNAESNSDSTANTGFYKVKLGQEENRILTARLSESGELDVSFGNAGFKTITLNEIAPASANPRSLFVALGNDHRFYIFHTTRVGTTISRLTNEDNPDTHFLPTTMPGDVYPATQLGARIHVDPETGIVSVFSGTYSRLDPDDGLDNDAYSNILRLDRFNADGSLAQASWEQSNDTKSYQFAAFLDNQRYVTLQTLNTVDTTAALQIAMLDNQTVLQKTSVSNGLEQDYRDSRAFATKANANHELVIFGQQDSPFIYALNNLGVNTSDFQTQTLLNGDWSWQRQHAVGLNTPRPGWTPVINDLFFDDDQYVLDFSHHSKGYFPCGMQYPRSQLCFHWNESRQTISMNGQSSDIDFTSLLTPALQQWHQTDGNIDELNVITTGYSWLTPQGNLQVLRGTTGYDVFYSITQRAMTGYQISPDNVLLPYADNQNFTYIDEANGQVKASFADQDGGRLLITGSAKAALPDRRDYIASSALTRLLPNGEADPAYQESGNIRPLKFAQDTFNDFTFFPDSELEYGWQATFDAKARPIIIGPAFNKDTKAPVGIAIVRFNAQGDIDSTFGDSGAVLIQDDRLLGDILQVVSDDNGAYVLLNNLVADGQSSQQIGFTLIYLDNYRELSANNVIAAVRSETSFSQHEQLAHVALSGEYLYLTSRIPLNTLQPDQQLHTYRFNTSRQALTSGQNTTFYSFKDNPARIKPVLFGLDVSADMSQVLTFNYNNQAGFVFADRNGNERFDADVETPLTEAISAQAFAEQAWYFHPVHSARTQLTLTDAATNSPIHQIDILGMTADASRPYIQQPDDHEIADETITFTLIFTTNEQAGAFDDSTLNLVNAQYLSSETVDSTRHVTVSPLAKGDVTISLPDYDKGYYELSAGPDTATVTSLFNHTPTITAAIQDMTILPDTSVTLPVTINDADNDALTIAILNNPGWLHWNEQTRQIEGVATGEPWYYNDIAIQVTDSEQATATTDSFSIRVLSAQTPDIQFSAETYTVESGQAFSTDFVVNDENQGTITVTAIDEPGWLTVSHPNGSWRLSGPAPEVSSAQTITVTLAASNQFDLTGQATISITVQPTNSGGTGGNGGSGSTTSKGSGGGSSDWLIGLSVMAMLVRRKRVNS